MRSKFRTVCFDCLESWDSKTISQANQIKDIHDTDNFVHDIQVVDYS